MPIAPQNIPTPPTAPNKLPKQPIGTNIITQQRRQLSQSQFSVRVCQVHNAQSISSGATTQIGFDTLSYVTYQALNQHTYSLKYVSATLGGHAYPYSSIVAPIYGYYHVFLNVTYNNGTVNTGLKIVDTIQFNPGDVISFTVLLANNSTTIHTSADTFAIVTFKGLS